MASETNPARRTTCRYAVVDDVEAAVQPVRAGRKSTRIPAPTALGTCLTSVCLTWWVSSFQTAYGPDLDHLVGPYDVPVRLEWSAAGVAVLLTIVGCVPCARITPRSWSLRSRATLGWLVAAFVIATAGWRVVTAGGSGANIGGAGVLLVGSLPVAALLCCALGSERAARQSHHSGWIAGFACVWLAAIGASAAPWFVLG